MIKLIKTVALSAAIGLASFAAMPSAALAQNGGVYLGFGNQGPSVGFHFDDRGRHDYRDRDRDRGRHHGGGYRDRGCSAREAIHKAERMGLRRARIVSENRRVIRVEGRTRGRGLDMVVFANERGCPTIR